MINKYAAMALVAGAALMVNAAYAQVATTIEQAELAGLTPQKRAEVTERARQPGQTVSEVLQTTLLNGIKNSFSSKSSQLRIRLRETVFTYLLVRISQVSTPPISWCV